MRVLSVRFKNLNSLAGEWAIDFEHPGFQEDGIFLISGPTGSGKSTILDAITLALYGQTPRLDKSGEQKEMLTRDESEFWSEVVFETSQGRFRSYWGRKRRPNGGFGEIKRELEKLGDQGAISDKDSIDKDLKRYGALDFGQFRRSVLLAQGGFDAFLKASEAQKAEILENLTDTRIYSQLSAKAWEVADREAKKTAALEARLEQIPCMGAEEMEAARKSLLALDAQLEALAREEQALQEGKTWLLKISGLERDREELGAKARDLDSRKAEFEPKRLALRNALKAAEIEGDYQRVETLRAELASHGGRMRDCAARKAQAEAKAGQLARDCASKAEGLHGCEAAFEAAKPLILEARQLDRDLAARLGEEADLARKAKQQRTALKEMQEELAQKAGAREEAANALAAAEEWLALNQRDSSLAGIAPKVDALLDQRGRQWRGIAEAEIKRDAQTKELEKATQSREAKARELADAAARCRRHEAALADIEAALNALLAGESLPDLRGALSARIDELNAARLVKRHEEARSHLHPGEPCPLCGALEHPYCDGIPIEPDLLAAACLDLKKRIGDAEEKDKEAGQAKERLHEAKASASRLEAELGGLANNIEILEQNAREAARAAAELRREAAERDAEIRQALEPLGMGELQDFSGLKKALDARLAAWSRKSGQKDELQRQCASLDIEIAKSQEAANGAAKALAEREAELAEARAALAGLQKARGAIFNGESAEQEEKRLRTAVDNAAQKLELANHSLREGQGELDRIEGELKAAEASIKRIKPELESAALAFEARLRERQLREAEFLAMRLTPERVAPLRAEAEALDEEERRLGGRIQENGAMLERERRRGLTAKSFGELEDELASLVEKRNQAAKEIGSLDGRLKENERSLRKRAELEAELGRQARESRKWEKLSSLIGSQKGDRFRRFAQNVTLDILLAHANAQLAAMRGRYSLRRAEGGSLESKQARFLDIEVVDSCYADAARPISNLSGGETFIISLALSLGLAEMTAQSSQPGSLFLDEGFGSLDEEALETALATIAALSREGKLIGIISHIEHLKDHIPARITVEPREQGRSRLSGPGVSSGPIRRG